jgi:hypothetical protein
VLSGVDHPNVVRFHGGCLQPPYVFIVEGPSVGIRLCHMAAWASGNQETALGLLPRSLSCRTHGPPAVFICP